MKKSPIAFAVAACFGASTAVDSVRNAAHGAAQPVTLIGAVSFSANGSSISNVSGSTATWSYETTTGVVTATGLYQAGTQVIPAFPGQLFTHNIVDVVIGGGNAAAATSYACVEGIFGTAVSASLCGNYNYGANYLNESTTSWGPGTAFDKTIGGDDFNVGVQQNLTSYDGMTTSLDPNSLILTVSNAIPMVSGQAITFCANPVGCGPNAVDDLENAGIFACAEQGLASEDIDVLDNDTGKEITPLTVTAPAPATPPPSKGTVAVNANNTVVYTSNVAGAAGLGLDQFQYIFADSSVPPQVSAPATVTVEVVPTGFMFPPDPVASDYRAAVEQNGVQSMDLVALGVVTPGYRSNYKIVTAPTAGTAAFVNPNSPVLNYTNTGLLGGVDDFIEYTVTDCNGNSDTGVVRMNIVATQDYLPGSNNSALGPLSLGLLSLLAWFRRKLSWRSRS